MMIFGDVQSSGVLSVMSRRWRLSQPNTSQECCVVGHADEGVLVDDAYGYSLTSSQKAHPGRVTRVELSLSCLNAAGAAQKGVRVHHHLIAGNVCEIEVVHLTINEVDTVQQHLQLPRAGVHFENAVMNGHHLPVSEDAFREIFSHLNCCFLSLQMDNSRLILFSF